MQEDEQIQDSAAQGADELEFLSIPEEMTGAPVESGVTGRLAVQELVRASLAFTFAGLLFVTVIFAFLSTGSGTWENTKELLQVLLPAETALLGSAVGFYFGSRGPS